MSSRQQQQPPTSGGPGYKYSGAPSGPPPPYPQGQGQVANAKRFKVKFILFSTKLIKSDTFIVQK